MDDLPILAFEKLLSYLDLDELLRARAVSRRWRLWIDNYTMKFGVSSLCFSGGESGSIRNDHRDHRMADFEFGRFARNFIRSRNFDSFFDAYGRTALSSLKHLRVYNLDVGETRDRPNAFVRILNSFEHLESLHLDQIQNLHGFFELILPKLKSIRLNDFDQDDSDFDRFAIPRLFLTLETPRLSDIRISCCLLDLNLMHPESVERMIISSNVWELEKFKNLKSLQCADLLGISDNLLSGVEQLREIHLFADSDSLVQLHDQKRRAGRNELKIYYHGVCLAHPNDYPESIHFVSDLSREVLNLMIANYSNLADELPFYETIVYSDAKTVRQLPSDFWHKLTGLKKIKIAGRIRNIAPFLHALSNCPTVRALAFSQPQSRDLFKQLLGHCPNLRCLSFAGHGLKSDFSFLFELSPVQFGCLTRLSIKPIDVHLISRIFNELNFIRCLDFECDEVAGRIERIDGPKPFALRINDLAAGRFSEIEGAAQAIVKRKQQRERAVKRLKI